jgi:hypothetical protein
MADNNDDHPENRGGRATLTPMFFIPPSLAGVFIRRSAASPCNEPA